MNGPHLGSAVVARAHVGSDGDVAGLHGRAQIANFDGRHVLIHQDVVWLQISEDDVSPVQVLESKQNLCEVPAGFLLGKSLDKFPSGRSHQAAHTASY